MLLFCQNDFPMRESFWQKDSLITHILFELQPFIIFSPVANFGDQSLEYFVIFKYRTRPEVPVKNAGNLRARFENMAKQNEEEAKRKAEEERKKREEKGIFYIFSCRFLNPIYFFPI